MDLYTILTWILIWVIVSCVTGPIIGYWLWKNSKNYPIVKEEDDV